MIKRRALKKLLKKNGFTYGGLYHRYESAKSMKKVVVPKIIVFFSGIAEYHIVQFKDHYVISDIGGSGATCYSEKELLGTMMKFEEKWYEWLRIKKRCIENI